MTNPAGSSQQGGLFTLVLFLALTLTHTLAAMEMPAELLRAAEMDVELPPGVLEESSMGDDNGMDKMEMHLMPVWLQQQHQQRIEPQQQQQQQQQLPLHVGGHLHEHLHSSKNKLQQKPLHKQPQQLAHGATNSLRRCSMEITNTVPGICQPMPPVGSACISGEFVDFLNAECM